jgi:hypothetical protein
MISAITFHKAVEAHSQFLTKKIQSSEDAQTSGPDGPGEGCKRPRRSLTARYGPATLTYSGAQAT